MRIIVNPQTPKIAEDRCASIEKARTQALARDYPREELARILFDYNKSLGNEESLPVIERIKYKDSLCVVTGQQLGFMGGPAYTILKALTCILIARDTNSIPIFWLATEDHDIHEIDRTYLVDELGNLKQYRLEFNRQGTFVEDLNLTEKHFEVIGAFLNAVKMADFLEEIDGETSYARAMAKFLIRLFKGTGLVLLEPHLLRPLAKDFFKKEIVHAEEIERVLQENAQKITESALIVKKTNLFFKDATGQRKKIVGHEQDWITLIDQHPERFSTNVIARPVLQTLLIPTLCYVAGPSELHYHQQLPDYFEFHGCQMPWLVPRLSATFITPEWAAILQRIGLEPWDKIPVRWEEVFNDAEGLQDSVERLGVPYSSLHLLNNVFHPQGKEQQRLLNWCLFQSASEKNLIHEFLAEATWTMNREQLYVYL